MDATSATYALPKPIVFGDDEPISSIIWRLSHNFETDILGRMLWYYNKLEISEARKREIRHNILERQKRGLPEENEVTTEFVKKVDSTNCVCTHHAIMSLFFGKCFQDSKALSDLNDDSPLAIHEMKKIIIEKEASANTSYRLQSAFFGHNKVAEIPLDENHWTAFSVKIHIKINNKSSVAHAFVLLQAYEHGMVFYKILQSYIDQYKFNQYDCIYTGTQIFLLLDEILDYVKSTHWNPFHLQLFNQFFHSQTVLPCWEQMNSSRWVKIKWGEVSRESIEKHAADYRKDFPDHYMISISN